MTVRECSLSEHSNHHKAINMSADESDDNSLLVYVERCLEDKIRGVEGGYDDLIREISEYEKYCDGNNNHNNSNNGDGETNGSDEGEQKISMLFNALASYAALLSGNHQIFQRLFSLFFSFDWSCSSTITNAFESFLVSLISSSPGYIEPVFRLLVSSFIPRIRDDAFEKLVKQNVTGIENPELIFVQTDLGASMDRKCVRIHKGIQRILRQMPLGIAALIPILADHFPKSRSPLESQRRYLVEVLKIIDYAPALRKDVITMIIDKILALDIEAHPSARNGTVTPVAMISSAASSSQATEAASASQSIEPSQVKNESSAESDSTINKDNSIENQSQGIPSPIMVTSITLTAKGRSGSLCSELESRSSRARDDDDASEVEAPIEVKLLAEKTDMLISALFDFIDEQVAKDAKKDQKKINFSLFDTFFDIFKRDILGHHGTNSSQFLMFYFASKRFPHFAKRFVEQLTNKALSNGGPQELRVRAAGYVSGFISRASFLSQGTPDSDAVSIVRSTILEISSWLNKYIKEHESLENNVNFSPRSRDVLQFYSVFQAMVYIALFKGNYVIDVLKNIDWEKYHQSPLKPFFYIGRDVANEFSRFAKREKLISNSLAKSILSYSFPYDENRFKLIEDTLSNLFPFDPCLLRRVANRIEPLYQRWYVNTQFNDDEEHESSSSEDNASVEDGGTSESGDDTSSSGGENESDESGSESEDNAADDMNNNQSQLTNGQRQDSITNWAARRGVSHSIDSAVSSFINDDEEESDSSSESDDEASSSSLSESAANEHQKDGDEEESAVDNDETKEINVDGNSLSSQSEEDETENEEKEKERKRKYPRLSRLNIFNKELTASIIAREHVFQHPRTLSRSASTDMDSPFQLKVTRSRAISNASSIDSSFCSGATDDDSSVDHGRHDSRFPPPPSRAPIRGGQMLQELASPPSNPITLPDISMLSSNRLLLSTSRKRNRSEDVSNDDEDDGTSVGSW